MLALDSYNRGYGQNVLTRPGDDITGTDEVGRRLGTAIIRADRIDPIAQAAGFYAIAYDWQGERVISYRGTNFPADFTSMQQITGALNDVVGGWSMFLGFGTDTHPLLASRVY